MAQAPQHSLTDAQLTGFTYFKKLLPLFAHLHEEGCARDRAHNRTLHYDQYCALLLLALFNPTLSSLRALQQASELSKVQKKLGCSRASLGSLSESSHVFDPELLRGIIGDLAQQLKPLASDPQLQDIGHVITLVDGTLLKALPRIAEAMWLGEKRGREQSCSAQLLLF